MTPIFKFHLNQKVEVACSDEVGTVIGRYETVTAEPQYFVRYKAADGRAVESWWTESALVAYWDIGPMTTAPDAAAPAGLELKDATGGGGGGIESPSAADVSARTLEL